MTDSRDDQAYCLAAVGEPPEIPLPAPRIHYQDDTITLHLGDSLAVLRTLPDQSVDCCVTSPPYLGLRSYLPEGHSDKALEIGGENTPAEYVEKIRALFADVRRVLADDGTLWLNIGDTYANTGGGGSSSESSTLRGNGHIGGGPKVKSLGKSSAARKDGIPSKNLLGIPWRVAFALQDDGWILRRDIIWAKRNCLPENVTDRPSSAHEYVFMFTKKPRYWYDADAIREDSDPDQEAHNERYAKVYEVHSQRAATTGQPGNVNNVGIHSRPGKPGRNARSVWTISSQPFAGAHFATMPPELARRCVVAGCKPDGTVLDPFHGSGTTGKVATENGRRYIGIELNEESLDLSLRTRLTNGTLDFGNPA